MLFLQTKSSAHFVPQKRLRVQRRLVVTHLILDQYKRIDAVQNHTVASTA